MGESVERVEYREGSAWVKADCFLMLDIEQYSFEEFVFRRGGNIGKGESSQGKRKNHCVKSGAGWRFSAIIFSLDGDEVFRYPTKKEKDKEVFLPFRKKESYKRKNTKGCRGGFFVRERRGRVGVFYARKAYAALPKNFSKKIKKIFSNRQLGCRLL